MSNTEHIVKSASDPDAIILVRYELSIIGNDWGTFERESICHHSDAPQRVGAPGPLVGRFLSEALGQCGYVTVIRGQLPQ